MVLGDNIFYGTELPGQLQQACASLTEGQTLWLELVITEGRNRQVRRMTAAVGHPTLRLIRAAIGPHSLQDLAPGALRG